MHKLAEICVRRPVFATMLVLALTVVGVFSFFSLGVDLLPQVDLPTVAVTVANPGASPEAVETEVIEVIEDSINTISGIEEFRSTAVEGLGQIIVTFELEKNVDVAAQEVRDKVNLVLRDLPETADPPVIQKFDLDAAPIMQVVVAAPGSVRDVTELAENRVEDYIEGINGVGRVQIVGGRRREIQVLIDPERLRAYNLTITDVANALREQNIELPGGRVEAGPQELTVRTLGRIQEVGQFNHVAVTRRGDYVVRISDLGRAEDAAEEPRTAARLNDQAAVILVVSKQSGENTVAVAQAVKQRLAEIAPTLPPGARVEVVTDQSDFIQAAIRALEQHLVEGSLLASVVIFVFLANIRTTLIAAVAIPTSIISTFGLMAAMDYTLNQITMLALTLMVGIVIDDAIIVLENIYRFIEEKGIPPFQAALAATREIGLAVTATTLSLLAVFLPVGFMGGIVGRFMSSFGLTASFAIAVSMLVSFTLTPMLCSRFLRPVARSGDNPGAGRPHGSKQSRTFAPIDRLYTRLLGWSMAHRSLVVAVSVAVIFSTVPLFMLIGKNFLPEDDRSQFEIHVRAPEGSSLAATSSVAGRIAREARGLPGVTDTLVVVGAGAQEKVSEAVIHVKLAPINERELSQRDLMLRARDLLKHYPPALRTSVQQAGSASGPVRAADIQFVISGPDLVKLAQYSRDLAARMRKIPYLADVDSSLEGVQPERRIEIDRRRAADLGVRVADIAQAVNTLIGGQVVSTFIAETEQYDVRLRATPEFRARPDAITRATVASTQASPVVLENVVRVEKGEAPAAIERFNRQRQVTLSANVLPGGSEAEAIGDIEALVKDMDLDPEYSTGLTGRSRELGRSAYYFGLAFALSFIFMYMVLAAQFESFIHPVTILLTLPLAVPFGILSLLVAGQTVNVFSGLGLLLLFGIVKKNAILQIDHTNGLRASGLERYPAIIQANRDRLRPILMTTLALVAGMVPLVFSRGAGSATNRSIGVLVAGGQTLCLLLTLVAVPVFYSLFEDVKENPAWAGFRRRLGAAGAGLRGLLPGRATRLLALALLASSALLAQTQLVWPRRVGVIGEKPITLREAVALAVVNNNDVEAADLARSISAFQLTVARGVYDPVLGGETYWQRQVLPIASLIGGAPGGRLVERELVATPQLQGLIPGSGGSYRADFGSTRLATNNQFEVLSPQYPTAFTFTVTQPLWRGLRFDDNRRQIEIARRNRQMSNAEFRQRVIETATQAAQAWWELLHAHRNARIALEAAGLARKQVESNQRRAEKGILAPVDVTEAETQLYAFQQRGYAALAALTRAENLLKALILPGRTSPLWWSALVPADPPTPAPPTAGVEEAVEKALAGRPEIERINLTAEINRIESRFWSEQAKPQVDLVGLYSSSGLAGTLAARPLNPFTELTQSMFERVNMLSLASGLPPLPPPEFSGGEVTASLVGGYAQSLSNLISGTFPTWRAGLQIAIPLRNQTARASLAAARVEEQRTRARRDQLEQAIEADVRNALQAVESASERLAAADQESRTAQEMYESEQRRFQAGVSTVFLVLQRQTAMIEARSREIRAQADLGQATAEYERATAGTLQVYGIAITPGP